MADEGGRRPKRNCVSRKNAVPSSVHYVGYVEDEETPEMIMKKFEEFEKIMAASKQASSKAADKDSAGNQDGTVEKENQVVNQQQVLETGGEGGQSEGLTEDILKEVFKQTSMFNVKTALQNNDALMALPGHESDGDAGYWSVDDGGSSDEEDWEYLKGFWSDEDGVFDKQRGRKGLGRQRGLGVSKVAGRASQKAKHSMIAHYNRDTHAFIRRKTARAVDPDALVLLKPPGPPLPLSWGRVVKPYKPPAAQDAAPKADVPPQEVTRTFHCGDPSAFDYPSLNKKYQAVLINPGWTTGCSAEEAIASLQKLPVPKLCPVGFVFVWAEKQHLMAVVKQAYKWGYIYIENLTWVMMHPNNSILRLNYPYAAKSHITLLIFRKECEEGRAIDLKHQRNPDVLFDCVQSAEGMPWKVPNEAYMAIETMLPTGMGVFLEIYGAKGVTRPGWDHIVQAPA